MDKSKRIMADGFIEKARTHLQVAEKHLKSNVHHSEAVEAAQECVELSFKAILFLLNIEFPRSHGWDPHSKEFAKIAEKIRERKILDKLEEHNLQYIRLPRLLFLVNFWSQFYLTAKYGYEAGNLAPASKLFGREEAELAVKHASECLSAASNLFHSEDKLAAIVS